MAQTKIQTLNAEEFRMQAAIQAAQQQNELKNYAIGKAIGNEANSKIIPLTVEPMHPAGFSVRIYGENYYAGDYTAIGEIIAGYMMRKKLSGNSTD